MYLCVHKYTLGRVGEGGIRFEKLCHKNAINHKKVIPRDYLTNPSILLNRILQKPHGPPPPLDFQPVCICVLRQQQLQQPPTIYGSTYSSCRPGSRGWNFSENDGTGFDASGFDASGFDASGFDASGRDEEGSVLSRVWNFDNEVGDVEVDCLNNV